LSRKAERSADATTKSEAPMIPIEVTGADVESAGGRVDIE
jgi:hypothetical protein